MGKIMDKLTGRSEAEEQAGEKPESGTGAAEEPTPPSPERKVWDRSMAPKEKKVVEPDLKGKDRARVHKQFIGRGARPRR